MSAVTPSGFDVRVGCDAQSVEDIRAAIEDSADSGARYLRLLFSADERALIRRLTSGAEVVRYVSGRFAAKEAVFKVLRIRPDVPLPLSQIEILADEGGAPLVRFRGTARELSIAAGVGRVTVSISHTAWFAFAVAVAVAVETPQQAVHDRRTTSRVEFQPGDRAWPPDHGLSLRTADR